MLLSSFQGSVAPRAECVDDRLAIYLGAGVPACVELTATVASGAPVTTTEIVVLVHEAHYPPPNLLLPVIIMQLSSSLFSFFPLSLPTFPSRLSALFRPFFPLAGWAQTALKSSLG